MVDIPYLMLTHARSSQVIPIRYVGRRFNLALGGQCQLNTPSHHIRANSWVVVRFSEIFEDATLFIASSWGLPRLTRLQYPFGKFRSQKQSEEPIKTMLLLGSITVVEGSSWFG